MNKLQPHLVFNQDIKRHLSGELFSNFKKIYLERKSYIPNRNDLLVSLLTSKNVLHFGCCDHEELIEKKINNGSYLHLNITKVAQLCIGVDIDSKALRRMQEFNISNCFYYDVFQSENSEIEMIDYDVILLGEILEHISNPVAFLNQIMKKFSKAKYIIITVPNALSSNNFYNIKKGIEEINTDHKYWFTPYTISKVISEAGFDIQGIYFADHSRLDLFDRIIKRFYALLGKNPFTTKKWPIDRANVLVAVATFK